MRAIALGAPPSRCHLVPYGVDPGQFTTMEGASPILKKELGLPNDSLVVFAVGRMVYKKGFEYLIRAVPAVLREHPNARIVIAGGGWTRSRFVVVWPSDPRSLPGPPGPCASGPSPFLSSFSGRSVGSGVRRAVRRGANRSRSAR